jgi:hypothetical protein
MSGRHLNETVDGFWDYTTWQHLRLMGLSKAIKAAKDVAFTQRTLNASLWLNELQANRIGANIAMPTRKAGSTKDIAQLTRDAALLNLDLHPT